MWEVVTAHTLTLSKNEVNLELQKPPSPPPVSRMYLTLLFVSVPMTVFFANVLSFRGKVFRMTVKPAWTSIMSKSDPSATTTTNLKQTDWSFLDDVYLITTSGTNNNRLNEIKEQLEHIKLWNSINVRTFPVDTADKVRGCYNSHIEVFQEIQRKARWKFNQKNCALILEDNLEATRGMRTPEVLKAVKAFVTDSEYDICYLAYMMYVPGMSLQKLKPNLIPFNRNIKENLSPEATENLCKHVVQMLSNGSSAVVGTTAYIISAKGVDTILRYNKKNRGYVSGVAIPNVMAELFASSRFAAHPMLFHRSGKISSLVNPQLDGFRRFMFSPALYTAWERLMVNTGLQNNQLLPAVLVALLSILLVPSAALVSVYKDSSSDWQVAASALVALAPLSIALWGAYLFQPGSTGRGFASVTRENLGNSTKRKNLPG